jgi:integrase/recombinase XerD
VPATQAEVVVSEFCDYLASERGLAAGTVRHHQRFACLFLTGLGVRGEADLADLTGRGGHLLRGVPGAAPQPGRHAVAGQRVALATALLASDRAGGASAGTRRAIGAGMAPGSLPRGVGAGQVAALLASCDRASAVGRRDYAILLLLTRLGLRAGEVIGITLDDLDWPTGALLVTGKTDQADKLPCTPMSARPWPTTCVTAGHERRLGTCSSRCAPRSPSWR